MIVDGELEKFENSTTKFWQDDTGKRENLYERKANSSTLLIKGQSMDWKTMKFDDDNEQERDNKKEQAQVFIQKNENAPWVLKHNLIL